MNAGLKAAVETAPFGSYSAMEQTSRLAEGGWVEVNRHRRRKPVLVEASRDLVGRYQAMAGLREDLRLGHGLAEWALGMLEQREQHEQEELVLVPPRLRP